MKQILTAIIVAVLATGCCQQNCYNSPEAKKAHELAARVLPSHVNSFVFEQLEGEQTDVYELSSEGGHIIIRGNNANSMATGLGHYLKYYCHREVSWFDYEHFTLPCRLPRVEGTERVEARVPERFFLNYCTFGYTMPWWTWTEWEHFIDWMALNGVNLALAITGQESIWYRIWTGMGLSDEQVRSYFSGPAHLPWHRMINIDGWGGPLPMSWLDGQMELQKQIAAREQELGIKPILPAFSGHVPAALKEIYPDAPITKLKEWQGFASEYACSFLDPTSELFAEIQRRFIEEQNSVYGSSHIYGIDPFNEVTPPSWEASYLARVGRQIYDSVAAADPEAIWLQMGWIFTYQRQNWTDERIEAYLGATPKDKQIILDYYCESTEVWPQTKSFFGTPYIWCYLGNFGGNPYMDGSFRTLEDRFENCYTNGGDNLVGIGCTLEGLDTNPYVYQYVLEKAWNSDITADIDIWTDALADQRTGKADAHARKAWHTLVDSIYVDESSAGLKFQIELLRPIFKTRTWVYSKNNLDKEIRILTDVLGQLVQADGEGDAYEFDLANISRQMLMCRFSALYRDYEKACNAGNWDELKPLSEQMLTNLDELEKVCATSLEFSLGKWIEDARRFGVDEAEKDYFETNARNLITSWAPNMHYGLNDYARRPYDGLIATYYKPRWEMFFEMMDAERDNFDWNAFNERSFSLERAWWAECQGSFKASTRGDIRKIAESLYNKYQKQ